MLKTFASKRARMEIVPSAKVRPALYMHMRELAARSSRLYMITEAKQATRLTAESRILPQLYESEQLAIYKEHYDQIVA
jgi:hypothetical protein